MECKNCKLYQGDCGHHYKDWNEHIHFDIPKESVTDQYGICYYYQEIRKDIIIALEYIQDLVNRNIFSSSVANIIANYISEIESKLEE